MRSQYWAHIGLMRALKAVITSVICLHIEKTKYYKEHKRIQILNIIDSSKCCWMEKKKSELKSWQAQIWVASTSKTRFKNIVSYRVFFATLCIHLQSRVGQCCTQSWLWTRMRQSAAAVCKWAGPSVQVVMSRSTILHPFLVPIN